MEPLIESLFQGGDRVFVYAVCAYLLWMQRNVIKDSKDALNQVAVAVKELSTLIREKLK